MLNRYIISTLIAVTLFLVASMPVSAEVYGPNVKIRNNTILISTGMNLEEKSIDEITKGVSKDIVFYVDLFRRWRWWPDEFVIGISVSQALHCDPVKKEYTVVSIRGDEEIKKRFESCEQLLNWTMSLPDQKLATVAGLDEEAKYYVVTTVESRIKRIPSFIKKFLFFVGDSEFKVKAKSDYFLVGETSE